MELVEGVGVLEGEVGLEGVEPVLGYLIRVLGWVRLREVP